MLTNEMSVYKNKINTKRFLIHLLQLQYNYVCVLK